MPPPNGASRKTSIVAVCFFIGNLLNVAHAQRGINQLPPYLQAFFYSMMDFEPMVEREWAEIMMPTVAPTTRAPTTTVPPTVATTAQSLQHPQEFWSFGSGPAKAGGYPNAPVKVGAGVPRIITSIVQGKVVEQQSHTGTMEWIALPSNAPQGVASARPPSPESVHRAVIGFTAQAASPSVLIPGNSHPTAAIEHPPSAESMHQKILATASSAAVPPIVVHAPVISTTRIAQPATGHINQPSPETIHQLMLANTASAAVPQAVALTPVKPAPVHSFIAQPATRFAYPLSPEAMHQMMLAAEVAAPPTVTSPPVQPATVRPAQPAVSHHYHTHPPPGHGYPLTVELWNKMLLAQTAQAAKTVPPTVPTVPPVPPAPVVIPTQPKLNLLPTATVPNKQSSSASISFKSWSNHVPSNPKIDPNADLLRRAVAARLKRLQSLISGQPLVLSELRVVPRQRKQQQNIQETPVRAIHERPPLPHAYTPTTKRARPLNPNTSRGFANAFISAHELIGAIVAARNIQTTPSYHSRV